MSVSHVPSPGLSCGAWPPVPTAPGVEVLELRPKLWWGLLLLPEHLALGDSVVVAALGGDCLDTSGSLAYRYEGASGTGISP